MVVSVWAAPAVDNLILPEKIFPQLDSLLKTAVQQSPRMINRALDLEVAENGRIQARAYLLPNLGGSASYSQADDDRNDGQGRKQIVKIAYNFALTQPVYYWGERRNLAHIGEIQATIAKGSYREGYRLLCQEIRSGYMGLIAQKLFAKRSEFYARYANDHLAQAEDRLTKKVISEAEIFPIRIDTEQAQITSEKAAFDFANAKASLARLAGVAEISDDSIPDSIPKADYFPATFDGLLAGYLAQKDLPTTEAVNMKHSLEVQNLTYENSKTALRPKFNLMAGTTQDEQSFTANVGQKYEVNSIYIGIFGSWSIFDGFSSRAATRSALARRRQIENDYRALTEQLSVQAQAQVKSINFAARSMAITERYLGSAEGFLNLRKEERGRGVRSEAEVTQAQTNLYDVQLNAINARADFLQKTGEFLGTIMEDPALSNVVEK